MKHFFLTSILITLFGCNRQNTSGLPTDLDLQVTDSIQVEYLGDLNVFDHDPQSGLYLGINHDVNSIVLFGDDGSVQHQFELQKDGPNAISWLQGKSFLEGKVTIMDSKKGLIQFDNNGQTSQRIEIPQEYFYLNGLNFSAYTLGKKYVYVRPERDLSDHSDPAAFYKRIYSSPILEVFDPVTRETSNTMAFPPGTVYSDGNFYRWMFPSIQKKGHKWYLFFLSERKYHVYEESGDELLLTKSVDLNLDDAVDMLGAPIENPSLINQQEPNIFGRIEHIYPLEQFTLLIYTKGVKKEISGQYDPAKMDEWMGFIETIPRYAAIFDTDDSLLQKDIELPKGLLFNGVSNGKDEILAMKNQVYFGTEEDIVTFYKLKVQN